MPTNAPRESATIYQFPAGGRAGLRQPHGIDSRFGGKDRFVDLPLIASGGSWYHDEAIREAAETPRKKN